jgi:peptidoglycan/xylan/chitin deacetylase (PgdA/CDA1 family)
MNRAVRAAARAAMPLRDPSLTVLCYHRVDSDAGHGLSEMVTSPSSFEDHLDLLEDEFSVIGLDDLVGWLAGARGLPPRAAMITLDDGYRDNYTAAYPILKRRGLPATIFLATGRIGSDDPFWWDRAAYLFDHTEVAAAELPFLGPSELGGSERRRTVMKSWNEAAKTVPDGERLDGLRALEDALAVEVPSAAFAGMHLSWSHVKEMHDNGISFGAHSLTHPILSRLPEADAAAEIAGSVERIHDELGDRPLSFAYPNGGDRDFTPANQETLRRQGVAVAFALSTGPSARLGAVRRDPLAIDRVYVDAADTAERVALKLTDLQRVVRWRHALRRPGAAS